METMKCDLGHRVFTREEAEYWSLLSRLPPGEKRRLHVFLVFSGPAQLEGKNPNSKLNGSVFGDAYIETFVSEWDDSFDEWDNCLSGFGSREYVSMPSWVLEEVLEGLFRKIHVSFSPQCLRFSEFIKSALDFVLKDPRCHEKREQVCEIFQCTMREEGHPHIETYTRYLGTEALDSDSGIDALIIRSRAGADYVLSKFVQRINTDIIQVNILNDRLLFDYSTYEELMSCDDMDAPSLTCKYLGERLAHLYRAVGDRFESHEEAHNTMSVKHSQHQARLREEKEAQAAHAADQERRHHIKEARAFNTTEKPLTTPGKPHVSKLRRGRTHVIRGFDKAGKIEEARQHQQELKEAEEKRQEEVRQRQALVRTGELIAGHSWEA